MFNAPGEANTPFVLSEALPSVPAKLVQCILKAEYVDMADLLRDNIKEERRRRQLEGGGGLAASEDL